MIFLQPGRDPGLIVRSDRYRYDGIRTPGSFEYVAGTGQGRCQTEQDRPNLTKHGGFCYKEI